MDIWQFIPFIKTCESISAVLTDMCFVSFRFKYLQWLSDSYGLEESRWGRGVQDETPSATRLPWSVTTEMNGWPAPPVKDRWELSPPIRDRTPPVIHTAVGVGAICYRLESITRSDVNISGVKVQRMKCVWCGLILYVLYEGERVDNGPKRGAEESSASLSTNLGKILIKGWTYGHINREALSVVASCSAEMCMLPRTFMTVGNGLWSVKDSLTVPLYCQADLHLAHTGSFESSTVSIKCSCQVLNCACSDCFNGDLISFTFHQ